MKSEAELKFVELLRRPNKTPEEIIEKDRAHKAFLNELQFERKELSEELKHAGSKYTDPWDMVNTRDSYPEAIDILIKHLPRDYHDKNKEGIIRALTVKEAKGKANTVLMEEYDRIPKEMHNLRWVIGNAIYVIVMPKDLDRIIQIVTDKENGMSRWRFVSALGKIKLERAEETLIKLLDDKEMCIYTIQALRRLKSKKAVDKISTFINSSDKSIRNEAQKAVAKIR